MLVLSKNRNLNIDFRFKELKLIFCNIIYLFIGIMLLYFGKYLQDITIFVWFITFATEDQRFFWKDYFCS